MINTLIYALALTGLVTIWEVLTMEGELLGFMRVIWLKDKELRHSVLKPLNCAFCMTFWAGSLLAGVFVYLERFTPIDAVVFVACGCLFTRIVGTYFYR